MDNHSISYFNCFGDSVIVFLSIHRRMSKYTLNFSYKFSILCLLIIILFCFLGVWQLQRYTYKKQLLKTYDERMNHAPAPFDDIQMNTNIQFKNTTVHGSYQNRFTILQSRYYQNKEGFEVYTPFQIIGHKKLLLVDRGWIPTSDAQIIDAGDNIMTIQGYIKYLNEYQFILGNNLLDQGHKPWIMQRIDLDALSKLSHYEYYPFILRLDRSQLHGFVRDWSISAVHPARHLGYAVQWFALAFVVFVAHGFFCLKKLENQDD